MFSRSRNVLALIVVAAVACAASAGCANSKDGDGDSIHVGDGSSPEDQLVSERQLNGSDMPDGTFSLTFDDGPGRRTSELADFLAEQGVKGTFFINGMKVPGRQSAIDSIVGRGHLLANHTQNHEDLSSLYDVAIVREVAETDTIITQAQPNGPWIFRAPFGAWDGYAARALNDSAMKKYVGSVFWDQGGDLTDSAGADWDCWGRGVSVERCGELYLQEMRSKGRGVVLLHDIHDDTVSMMIQILPILIAEGYKFVGLENVPSVKRAIAASAGPAIADNQCPSATLGRPVDENVCVQSRSNSRWSRCVAGDWVGSTGLNDPNCIERFPL